MNNDNLEFCEKIITKEGLEQYNILKNYEEQLKDKNDNKQLKIIIIQNMLNMLNIIYDEKNELKSNSRALIYNNMIYKLRLLFKVTNKDEQLEDSFLTQNEINNIEKQCLKKIEKFLKKSIYDNTLNNISITFLYLLTLLILKIDIDNYCRQSLTINDNNYSYFNISFNNEINVKDTKENINKVKNLIFSLNKK